MQDWIPKLDRNANLLGSNLSAEEGFVLSRLDGATPASQLPHLTGLPLERVQAILAKLAAQGLLMPREPAPAPTAPPPAARAPLAQPEPPLEPMDTAPEDDAPVEDAQEDTPSPEEEAAQAQSEGTYRQLFETKLHPLPADERAAQARTADDAHLAAFCFDPVPAVIKSVLEHPRVGLTHARLIARHHRNPVGLEALANRAAFAADAQVRRWLVRNPQLPAGLFRRLYAGRRMLEQHKLSMDREVPEGTRRTARELLRSRFATGPAEERVELILNTEGRVLGALVGLAIDGKTTSLLCGRTYRSPMLIQNLARWSAAPPALIAHLLKQDAVRRAPQIKAMLQRHPNAPSHAKRNE